MKRGEWKTIYERVSRGNGSTPISMAADFIRHCEMGDDGNWLVRQYFELSKGQRVLAEKHGLDRKGYKTDSRIRIRIDILPIVKEG